ncbi:2-oxoglutarate dehydrogenase complex dihydrolipoyllysine-residue succinyltransferase [Bermanella marisrubri]|uniref:Dihydrolipoyllysine-residue succinyltransferase component of 2-oxoglutarate dehydrogenase complex n=1 Tax=Bermanella marisrubri TaxID=207949 RepID=Q1N6I7_9GAMM|nr:2-oxoglutarate dehydrogenase complex dihydrolipoyllysine-residue succinyltransferase [Bermanella marisrubri]EAT13605.1 2-oxoglutarate dehydrogenase, E2 component, dihydrolipoamide succinyltransferase [Oceanobacter sp. RED65] [Bermanella marisrubri]QIZ84393.1 2-oxoglutarate dehydrogenase complex dihydrolipoyllysine-residue succinyltransferase [Bermanella marisrubri]
MSTEIKAPVFPESVADGTIATWHKQPGEQVSRDELLVDIETDKVVLEVVAQNDGVLKEIIKAEGDTVLSSEVVGIFEEGATGSAGGSKDEAPAAKEETAQEADEDDLKVNPAARKLAEEKGVQLSAVKATGKDGRITKEDVLNHIKAEKEAPAAAPAPKAESAPAPASAPSMPSFNAGERAEKRVPMTRLRATIAKRLVSAQQNAAMLTTYNEVDMKAVMELRSQYKDMFEKKHDGVRLGFMGFFVKAATEALKRFPSVNASIDGNDIVYHGYQDIGVAVSTDKGLVVPVLRDVDAMGLADIEGGIVDYAKKAKQGKLGIEEMQGGTFTITNGGVFGSLMSTPILNPPQTAILGMHKIQERPMAINGQVEIRPMMYLALSYDHRMIDGKEAVQFLVTIKELLEDPARILLDV